MNITIVYGNLGSEPRLGTMPDGGDVCNFDVADNERFRRGGEKQSRVTWHSVSVFGPRAKPLSEILSKGQSVIVYGRQKIGALLKDGKAVVTSDIAAKDVEIVGPRPQGRAASGGEDIPY